MTGAPEALDDLFAHARETRVAVIGGGVAGLVAAWECAKVGMTVTVVEASERLGGTVGRAAVAGIEVGSGATCWSTRGGAVRRLVDEVLPDAVIARPRDDRSWIAGLPGGSAAPLPAAHVLGIPANPWDEDFRRVIGWGGAWRAYLDRLRPPLTIGAQRSLGVLVRGRMGRRVLDRLVAPVGIDRFGVHPDDIDVEVAAPGLNSALTRTGSLGGAVAEQLLDSAPPSEPEDAPDPPVESLVGGMPQLVAALEARLVERGVAIRTGTRATGLTRRDGAWIVATEDGADAAAPVPAAAPAASSALTVDAVIVATDETAARALLAPALADPALADPALASAPAGGIAREVVTLVVTAPVLDAAPRGAHVHAVPGSHRATGLVHETARWEWLARAAGAGRHVLRVAFGARGLAPATEGLSDAEAFRLAADEASTLLGVALSDLAVIGARRDRFTLAPPASARGRLDAAKAARAAIARAPGLAAVGAWLSGSGLALVVADAHEEADRLRRSALWGDPRPS